LVCECGYEFAKHNNIQSSVALLSEKIDAIKKREKGWKELDEDFRKKQDQDILDTITVCPVPNTKEDIMDFLALATPNAKKQGGIMGSPWGKLCVFIPIVLIAAIVAYFVLPEVYISEEPKGFSGIFTGEKETHESALAAPISGIILLAGIIASFALAFETGKDTYRHNKFAKVWRAKFEQVLMKGRSLRADAEFTRMLDYYEKQVRG